jgi:hypothetical protein
MLVHNAEVTGSLKINNIPFNSGSFSGSFRGDGSQLTGVTGATTASYVEYNNVANKPALVSGSSQITYSGLSGVPAGIVSGSSQVTYSGLTGIPSGIVSGSSQVTYSGLTGIPAGIVSGSTQVSFNGITDKPALVSSSAQIVGYGVFATTGSNQFNGSQAITGSLTVTGQVVAQTLNVQQVTSSIVYSSGSNIFGNTLGNIQQFTGSVSVTGSLAVAGAVSGTSAAFSGLITGQTTSAATITQNFLAYNSGGSISGASYDFQSGGTSQTARISANYEASSPDRMAMRFLVGQGSGLVEILKLFNSTMTVTGAATFSSSVTAGSTITNLTSGGDAILYAKNGTVTTMVVANTTGELMGIGGTETNHPYIIRTANTERFRIASTGAATFTGALSGTSATFSGNVGLGVTSAYNIAPVTIGGNTMFMGTSADGVTNSVIGTISSQVRNYGVGIATSSFASIQFVTDGTTYYKGDIRFLTNGTDGTSTSGTERMRITSDGYVRLTSSSGGIQFNGDTAAANALDDYEEGTCFLVVTFGGASVGITYTTNIATYTKIGRQVTVNGFIILSSKGSSTGDVAITGLPFTVGPDNQNFSAVALRFANITFANQFQGFARNNTTTIEFEEITEAGSATRMTNSDFANNSNFMISLTYFI